MPTRKFWKPGSFRFNSGLEDKFAEHLRDLGIPHDYERDKITYVKPITKSQCLECGSKHCGQNRVYTPDFFLPDGVVIELKGYLDQTLRAQFRLIRDQHPGLDLRFIFQQDNVIKYRSGNTERYSQWAKDLGYPYWICKKEFPPKEWFDK